MTGPVAAGPTIRPALPPHPLSLSLTPTSSSRTAAVGAGGVAAALVLTDKQDSVSGKPQDCQPQSPKRITSRRRKAGQCLGGGDGDGGESFIKMRRMVYSWTPELQQLQ